jgi:hypothetical protein
MHCCTVVAAVPVWHGNTGQYLQPSAHVPALFGGTGPCPGEKSPPPPIHDPVTLSEKQRPTYAEPMPFWLKP